MEPHSEKALFILLSMLLMVVAGVVVASAGTADAQDETGALRVKLLESTGFFNFGSTDGTSVGHTMKVSLRNGYKRPLCFAVLYVRGFNADQDEIRINEHLSVSHDRETTLYEELNGVPFLLWLGRVLKPDESRIVSMKVPMNAIALDSDKGAARFELQVASLGFRATDAFPWLGSHMVSPNQRKELATRLSKLRGRRFRYLDAEFMWVLPEGEAPAVARSEQTTHSLSSKGTTDSKRTKLLIQNKTDISCTIRLAGQGHLLKGKIPGGESLLREIPPGLVAVSLRQGSGIPATVVIETKAGQFYTIPLSAD